jgi:hypothetical protein
MDEKRFDHVIVVCKGCHRERRHDFDRLFTTKDVVAWVRGGGPAPFACLCGSPSCDLKFHMIEVANAS